MDKYGVNLKVVLIYRCELCNSIMYNIAPDYMFSQSNERTLDKVIEWMSEHEFPRYSHVLHECNGAQRGLRKFIGVQEKYFPNVEVIK